LKNNINQHCCVKNTYKTHSQLITNNVITKQVIQNMTTKNIVMKIKQTVSNQLKRIVVLDINEKPSKIIHIHLSQAQIL
jgi:hypothetical protein